MREEKIRRLSQWVSPRMTAGRGRPLLKSSFRPGNTVKLQPCKLQTMNINEEEENEYINQEKKNVLHPQLWWSNDGILLCCWTRFLSVKNAVSNFRRHFDVRLAGRRVCFAICCSSPVGGWVWYPPPLTNTSAASARCCNCSPYWLMPALRMLLNPLFAGDGAIFAEEVAYLQIDRRCWRSAVVMSLVSTGWCDDRHHATGASNRSSPHRLS